MHDVKLELKLAGCMCFDFQKEKKKKKLVACEHKSGLRSIHARLCLWERVMPVILASNGMFARDGSIEMVGA